MPIDAPKHDSSTSAKTKQSPTGGTNASKLDAFLTNSATAVDATLGQAETHNSFAFTDPATLIPKISSLVQPKESAIPRQVKTSSLVQQGPVQSRRASRIRGSERGA